ncbi:MAG: methyl-accepting chemotaxis protein, partial [Lachnospiraceae bacterium]|nr:methyl-accepting chemotaxis protein [Lachnospiraceae bacterium]
MQMFITQMRGTISEIKDTADWLNVQSQDNEKVSDSLKVASEKQAGAMEVLGQMVEQISAAAQEVSAQMELLANLIGEAGEEGHGADRLMKESVVLSKNGKEDMENINNGMTSINASITTLSEQVAKVGEATTQIGDMVNMIMDIAEETNLLSLNASIEAARAGEAGRGFAVVAEQIGKLAANSSTAADDISRLTTEIQATVALAVEHMNTSVSEVQKSVVIVADASDTFDGLYDKVDETSRRVDKMIELVGRVDDVAGSMEQTTRSQVQATEQIVQSADTLSEHTRNVAADSNTVAESAQQMKKEAMELAGRIDKFKV